MTRNKSNEKWNGKIMETRKRLTIVKRTEKNEFETEEENEEMREND